MWLNSEPDTEVRMARLHTWINTGGIFTTFVHPKGEAEVDRVWSVYELLAVPGPGN